jgi:hypothetical protein
MYSTFQSLTYTTKCLTNILTKFLISDLIKCGTQQIIEKCKTKKMLSSGMLHHVALLITEVSEKYIASIIRVTRIGELWATLALTSNQNTLWRNTVKVFHTWPFLFNLMVEEICSSETSVLTRATQRNIPEGVLHSHRHKNLKSYIALIGWVLYRRRNVFLVSYHLGFCIPVDGILHSHRPKNLKA